MCAIDLKRAERTERGWRWGSFTLLGLLLLLLGRQGLAEAAPVLAPAATQAADLEVSEEEKRLIAQVEREFSPTGLATGLAAVVDADGFLKRCARGLQLPEDDKRMFLGSMREGVKNAPVLRQLREGTGPYGRIQFLRPIHQDGERRLLFRLHGDSGFIYLAFVVERDTLINQVRFVDLHSSALGELFSDMLRTMMTDFFAAFREQGFQMKGVSRTFTDMTKAIRLGNHAHALEIYKSASEPEQKNRLIMIARITAASNVSVEEHVAAAEDMLKVYPDDPTARIHAVPALVYRKKYDEALRAVDRMDEIYHDPFLDHLRAQIATEGKDWPAVAKFAKSAVVADPKSYHAASSLLTAALELKDYPLVADALNRLAFDVGVDFLDLRQIEIYAGFVASPEFEKWEQQYKTRAATRPARR